MMNNNVNELARLNHYNESTDLFWKEIDDYLIVLTEKANRICIEVRSGLVASVMARTVALKVAEIAELENVSDCIINKESIHLYFEIGKVTPTEVEEKTQMIVSLFKENDIPAAHICPHCKEDMRDRSISFIKINQRFLKVHKDCYELINESVLEQKNNGGNYITGIFGALLFGALGTIPWILMGILGWVVSLLGMVIGISANYGYNLFHGKKGKIKSITLVLVLIIMVIVAGVVTQLYDLFDYLKSEGIEGVTLSEGLDFLRYSFENDSEFSSGFIWNMAFGIGFGLLGSWRVIKESSIENTKNTLNIELVE